MDAGIRVTAGYDIEPECRFAYEHNNAPARFFERSVTEITGRQIRRQFEKRTVKVLAGCAPCVTFSKYTQGKDHRRDPKWSLLGHFARLVRECQPDIVSMENVTELQRQDVFGEFLDTLEDEGFFFEQDPGRRELYCPDYGVPQKRTRLVLLASRFAPIKIVRATHPSSRYRTVRDALGSLPRVAAGGVCPADPLHRASGLSSLNMKRIRCSKPGGTWRDWPSSLIASCHNAATGQAYSSVYGRMAWDEPSPTITTQFFGFGSGRFGHPKQARGLSLREGALLQTFPKSYAFVEPGQPYRFKVIGKMIGNAVPVRVGEIIGRSIRRHLERHGT